MKNPKDIQQKLNPLILLTLFFVTNNSAMVQKSSLPLETKNVHLNLLKQIAVQNKKDAIQKELTDAGWSKEKILELRLRYTPKNQNFTTYDSTKNDSSSKFDYPNQKILNNILIDHYTQKIYTALETIPVEERIKWITDLRSLVAETSKVVQNKAYYIEPGSEAGPYGTKRQALDNLMPNYRYDIIKGIPFNKGPKITPADFFKKIAEPDYEKSTNLKKIFLLDKSLEKKEQHNKNPEQEQKNAFMSDEELEKQLALERQKQYEPNRCLIYEKGTSKGVSISKLDFEKYADFGKNMFEDFNSLPDEISLDFSYDVIKIVLNEEHELKTLSWNQLVDCIKCYDYLGLKELPLSKAYYTALAYWVNEIGNKIFNLIKEMATSYGGQIKSRSIEAIEKDLPDYSIFKEAKIPYTDLLEMIKKIKNNFLEQYKNFYHNKHHRTNSENDRYIQEYLAIRSLNDINKAFDLMKQAFDLEKENRKGFEKYEEEKEDAKKWFWQRKEPIWQGIKNYFYVRRL